MKTKKIVGLMACAAFASAFADPINNNVATTNNQWFVGNVQSSALHADGAAWDNSTAGATVNASNKIEIDNDLSTALTLTPTVTESKTAADRESDGLVIISAAAYLTPSAFADLPAASALGDAQVGFAVAIDNNVTNYYAYTRTGDSTGSWVALTGANPPDTEATDTEFKIVLDYRISKAKFYVTVNNAEVLLSDGNSVNSLTFVPVNPKVSNVAAFGSGTITEIKGGYENAVAVGKDGKPYGTIAEAYNATGEGTVVAWDSTTGAAATGDAVNAANGASKAVCLALNVSTTDADAVLTFVPASENANNIVLQTAIAPVDDVTVTFAVKKGDAAASGSYPANAIPIPKEAGQYTIVPTVSAKSN
jgi:hypothetical protein